MTTRDLLLQQFENCTNKPSWFVTLQNALSGLTSSQAAWRTDEVANSIWQIVNHLTFWNERSLRRFRGEDVGSFTDTNDATFESDEAAWEQVLSKLDSVMSGWKFALESCDETKMDEQAFEVRPSTWATVIADINTHNAYHIGQIVIIRRLQGSWTTELGVS